MRTDPQREQDRHHLLDMRQWPVVVYLGALVAAFLSTWIADLLWHPKSHPVHWLAALIGGMIGIGLGWLWYTWRGDIS